MPDGGQAMPGRFEVDLVALEHHEQELRPGRSSVVARWRTSTSTSLRSNVSRSVVTAPRPNAATPDPADRAVDGGTDRPQSPPKLAAEDRPGSSAAAPRPGTAAKP